VRAGQDAGAGRCCLTTHTPATRHTPTRACVARKHTVLLPRCRVSRATGCRQTQRTST
jgi:hypothetical protein